jgi:hypothetical protein
MKGKFGRKALAAALALLIVSGGVPTYSNVDLFWGTAITASAEEQGMQTVSFTTAGSITNIDYFVYVGNSTNAVTNPDSLNIEGGSAVKVNVAYDSGYKPTLTAECTVSNSINVTSSDDSGNRIVTYEFTMPHTGNVKVQIQMNPIYSTLTVANTENGTVSVRTPKTSYPTGERVYLDITPAEGYTISTSVYSYNVGSGMYSRQIQNDESGYYIEMPPADTTVEVQFSKIQQVYLDNDEKRGKVELKSPAEEMICENTYVYIKVIPAEDYKLKDISVDSPEGEIEVKKNGGYEDEFYFLMPDSYVWVTPDFVTTKKVTVDAAGNGTVTIKNDSEYVDSGDKVLLDVKPDEGYALSDLWFVTNEFTVHPSDIDENGYYYFTMPEHDVELHAEFVAGKTVTVDLGKGHEELAKKFSGISGYTVNGTEISYAVPNDKYTVGKVERDFSDRAREIALGKVIDADGKKFMGEIRLHSEYQNEELYQQELGSNLPAEGMTFKAMWAEPISELTITAPDYKCGKELETSYQDGTTRYKPCDVQVSEGVSLKDYHLFYTNWKMENNETVLRGGNNYNIYGYIEANYNTYLTDNISINVEDGDFVSYDPKMSRFEISVPIEHNFDENGGCTSCGTESYTITWKNGDETLETDNYVPGGATPEYNGETPTKADDTMYSYSFAGWSPNVSAVSENAEYTATFTNTPKTYNVTYKVDGVIYGDVDTVAYGTALTARDVPARDGYIFSGWSEIPETMPDHDIEITGTFSVDENYGKLNVADYKSGDTWTAPTQEGKVFAGWFADSEYTTPYMETTGYAYAKFIDEKCITVKWQKRLDNPDPNKTDIRLVSTLDCGDYDSLHFVLTFTDNGFVIKDGQITRLYDSLDGFVNGKNVSYTPDIFCEDSKYFAAYTVTGMPNSLYDTSLTAKVYIITLDGTRVE